MDQFETFIQKEKFVEDITIYYPGLSDPTMQLILTEKINEAAKDLREVFLGPNPTRQAYLDKIKIGLDRFSNSNLIFDTEDKERVCQYFEELMDIVGLESSDGILNSFLYGFNPNESDN